jgi:hypothetical protein
MENEVIDNEQPVETIEQAAEQVATPTDQPQIDIESFNKFFESKYENADQLKSDFSKLNQLKEYDGLKADHEKLQLTNKELAEQTEKFKKEREEFLEYANIEKHFGGKENYKNFKIMQQMKEQGKNEDVVRSILANNPKEFDVFEKALYGELLDSKEGDMKEAAKSIFRYLGVTKDRYEEIDVTNTDDVLKILDAGERTMLRELAKESTDKMLAIKNTEVPEIKNYEQQLNEKVSQEKSTNEKLLNDWSNHLSKIKETIDSVKFYKKGEDGKESVIFEFPIDKGVIARFEDWAKSQIISSKIALTDENKKVLADKFIKEYAKENWEQISNSRANDIETRLTDEYFKKTHNATPFNTTVNKDKKSVDVEKSQMDAFGYKKK